MKITVVLALTGWLVAGPALGDEGPDPQKAKPTVDDVLAMMAKVPNECTLYNSCPKSWGQGPAGFDQKPDARVIAEAIAAGVASEPHPIARAALAVVYAAYESGNQRCASGDGGRSWGAWQVKGLSKLVACNPALELPVWLAKVAASERICGEGPYALAALASGDCAKGREKVSRRVPLVETLTN